MIMCGLGIFCEWNNYREILTDTLNGLLVDSFINNSAFIGMYRLRIRHRTWAVVVGELPLTRLPNSAYCRKTKERLEHGSNQGLPCP